MLLWVTAYCGRSLEGDHVQCYGAKIGFVAHRWISARGGEEAAVQRRLQRVQQRIKVICALLSTAVLFMHAQTLHALDCLPWNLCKPLSSSPTSPAGANPLQTLKTSAGRAEKPGRPVQEEPAARRAPEAGLLSGARGPV